MSEPTVGERYSDGQTEHEVVGVSDGDVDVVEYEDGEAIGEYTVDAETFRERMG
jgi:hypothetical protein